ncbi:hypothetical protein N7V53_14750 [Kosakonia sp. HypNH10]|uniref:hypothetical protein n=1 Tax=Kosakonia sp. HypNH10 TaxID=2980101 RepID=UPI00244A7764|nr:hypothetical protein [Kosakonia sp. HypNH10]MDH2913780.1 hypothetical protein [Kosakonia sp. HypNH10]
MQEEVKPLVGFGHQRYFSPAPAKSDAGIGTSGDGNNHYSSESALMATIPTQTHPFPKTERRYTVGYAPNQGDTSTPCLNLSGKWLKRFRTVFSKNFGEIGQGKDVTPLFIPFHHLLQSRCAIHKWT